MAQPQPRPSKNRALNLAFRLMRWEVTGNCQSARMSSSLLFSRTPCSWHCLKLPQRPVPYHPKAANWPKGHASLAQRLGPSTPQGLQWLRKPPMQLVGWGHNVAGSPCGSVAANQPPTRTLTQHPSQEQPGSLNFDGFYSNQQELGTQWPHSG